jgi:hypothetical protein
MKGVLIEFAPAFDSSMPNVIAFQFNPDTLRRTWTQPPSAGGANPLAVQGTPGEDYALTLMLDSTDVVAAGPTHPGYVDALATGLASRLAALELLMFPVSSGAAPGGAGGRGRAKRSTPSAQVPAVLFMWGPGRILPVRITTLSITERLFDENLNPTQATVELGFKVLMPKELARVTGPFKDIALEAHRVAQRQRETLAAVNVTVTAATIPRPSIPGRPGP